MITPTHDRANDATTRRRSPGRLRRLLPDQFPAEREFFQVLISLGALTAVPCAVVASSVLPVLLQFLGAVLLAGVLGYTIRATVLWFKATGRQEWIEAGGGAELAEQSGQVDALRDLVEQWRELCTTAGIGTIPPVQVDPHRDELAPRLVTPLYTVANNNGQIQPRLRIGMDLLTAPVELRRQLLAQQVGHLLAGHTTQRESFTHEHTAIDLVAGIARSNYRFAGLLLGLHLVFGLGVLGFGATEQPLARIDDLLGWSIAHVAIAAALAAAGAAWSRDRIHTADLIAADRLGLPITEDLAYEATAYEENDHDLAQPEITDPNPTWIGRWQAGDYRDAVLALQPSTPTETASTDGGTVLALSASPADGENGGTGR